MNEYHRILLILLYLAADDVKCLKCFTCSHHKGTNEIACPTSSSDRTWFEDRTDRYDSVDPSIYWCSIRVLETGAIHHQGYTKKEDCNDTTVIQHIKNLVETDTGTIGSQFVCCDTDGCNWSLDSAIANTSLLTAALPFIIAGIIAFAILIICFAVCCASGCCAACGCLGCCCCDEANKVKLNRNVNTTEDTEPSININERYRSLARPGSESSTATALTPVGSPLPGSRSGNAAVASDNSTPATITVETAGDNNTAAAQDDNVKKMSASKLESIDGVPNPSEVENDRITRTARYYFQPKYN